MNFIKSLFDKLDELFEFILLLMKFSNGIELIFTAKFKSASPNPLLVIPITFPYSLNKGAPLLPWVISAVVWIKLLLFL